MYTSLWKQYRQTQLLLPQTKVQDATQGLLAPQDAKVRGGMEESPTAARKTQSCMKDANWNGLIRRPETKQKKEQAGFGPLPVLQQEQVKVTREMSTQQFEHHNP